MVKLSIDNQIVEAEAGSTILAAATKLGIDIPTLCYHENLTPEGSCRVCTVEVIANGASSLTTACTYPVEAGLEVKTNSAKALEARRLAVELLLSQRPHSGKIAALARELGIEQPSFTLEEKECILCRLCVRTCRELVGVRAIDFIAQGLDRDVDEAFIDISPVRCIACGSCAYICPTLAINMEDVGDTRKIISPKATLEFKMRRCKTCGRYWAPEKQLEYIIKLADLPAEAFDNCPDCRD